MLQEFYEIWPCDIAFDATRPIFEVSLDLIKKNILTKFQHVQAKNVFDTTQPIFELGLDIIETNFLTNFQAAQVNKAVYSNNKIFLKFGLLT